MPRTEKLSFRAGDATLVGTLTLPDEQPEPEGGRYPNVMLLSSWLPRDRDGGFDLTAHRQWFADANVDADAHPARPGLLARLASALADRGVATLRYDPRGCGESDGEWERVDLFTRIDDARDALGALRSNGRLDLRRTGIVGHGEGAIVAMSMAIADPAVGALTLIGAPARSWADVLRRSVAVREVRSSARGHPIVAALDRLSEELLERAERGEAFMVLPLGRSGMVRLELRGIEQAIRTSGRALGTMLHRSVTLVHGGLDEWCHPDESALLESVLVEAGNEPTRRVVDGAVHDLADADEAVISEIAADLARRLEPRDLPPVLLAIQEMG